MADVNKIVVTEEMGKIMEGRARRVIDAAVASAMPFQSREYLTINLGDFGPYKRSIAVRLDQDGLREKLEKEIEYLAEAGIRTNYSRLIRAALIKFMAESGLCGETQK